LSNPVELEKNSIKGVYDAFIDRNGSYSIEDVIQMRTLAFAKGLRHTRINHLNVSIDSRRIQTFLYSGFKCVSCGIQGSYFVLERHGQGHQSGCGKWHLSLYGLNDNNEEVLMTRDHILPRSLGGKNTLRNSQTMCAICNRKKANLI
jgi:hypothetical protein